MIGAPAEDIALVESATVGWRRAVDAMRLKPGDRVVATRTTYVSSALQLLELERSGVTVDIVADDAEGRLDLDALEAALAAPAALLAATHVPTSSGRVEPVAAIGALADAAGAPTCSTRPSRSASSGRRRGDRLRRLVTTGRKFRGRRVAPASSTSPRRCSTGCGRARPTCAARSGRRDALRACRQRPPLRDLGGGPCPPPRPRGRAERGAGDRDRGDRRPRVGAGRLPARAAGGEVAGVRVVDPPGRGSGIVTFVIDGEEPQQTRDRLAAAGCDTVVVPASHGLWEMQPRGLAGVVRASFHVYNGEDDIEAVIPRCAAILRRRVAAAGRAARRRVAARPWRRPVPGAFAARGVEHFDVVVAGAGVHGRSAAWNLARSGKSVLLLERGRLGHGEGSSHGATRMIRRAYPSDVWDDLVDRAYAGWAELEEAAGTSLFTTTGGIYAHPAGDGGGLRGPAARPSTRRRRGGSPRRWSSARTSRSSTTRRAGARRERRDGGSAGARPRRRGGGARRDPAALLERRRRRRAGRDAARRDPRRSPGPLPGTLGRGADPGDSARCCG